MKYTQDWSAARRHWPEMLKDLVGRPDLRFLEIGCFEGRTTVWLLENVLTDPSSRITVVDTFVGQPEYEKIGVSVDGIYQRFCDNVRPWSILGKIDVWPGPSCDVLPQMVIDGFRFDFIYVDASHRATDVLLDGMLSWAMLEYGGIMAFDDYAWDVDLPDELKPKAGVDAFLNLHRTEATIVHQDYQLAVRKL